MEVKIRWEKKERQTNLTSKMGELRTLPSGLGAGLANFHGIGGPTSGRARKLSFGGGGKLKL